MPILTPAQLSAELQNLELDRLVKLYILDASALGGSVWYFCSSVDAIMDVTSLDASALVVTCVTPNPHSMITGDPVQILNATDPGYNVASTVTVVDDYTFTYNIPAPVTINPDTSTNVTATRLNNTMSFNGNIYTPVPFTASGFEVNGQGSLPLPKIQVGNVNKILQGSVRTLNDLAGATFTRIRTLRKHLDDGSDPDTTAIMPIEVYRVNRKTNQNRLFIEFELATNLDQEAAKIPARQCIKYSCTHIYRRFNALTGNFDYTEATCPYADTHYFTDQDVSTSDPSLDQCGKQLNSCKLRFGTSPLPTRAFPGISQ